MNRHLKNRKSVAAKPPAAARKTLAWLGAALIAAGGLAAGTYCLFFKPSLKDAPSVKADQQKIAGYLASDKFSELSMADKKSYVKQLAEGNPWRAMRAPDIPREEREKLRENVAPVVQELEKDRLDKFFKMSKEEQQKEIERIVEQIKQRRAQQAPRTAAGAPPPNQPGGAPPGRGPGGGRNAPARQKARYETTSPVTRAQQTEFRKMIMRQLQSQSAAPAK